MRMANLDAAIKTVEKLLNVPIDYYVTVNMAGLIKRSLMLSAVSMSMFRLVGQTGIPVAKPSKKERRISMGDGIGIRPNA
jgi:hypothetical protein